MADRVQLRSTFTFDVDYSGSDIVVFDTNGNQVAIFSHENFVFDPKKQRNLMSEPTVNIVSNGHSTLTFKMLTTSVKWSQINDPRYRWYCDGRYYTMLAAGSLQYQGEVVQVTLYEEWVLLNNQFVQVHNVDLEVEAMDVHTVKILPKTSAAYRLTVNGTSYEDGLIKDSRGVLLPRGSAGYALWAIIRGNTLGWTLGICDVIVSNFNASADIGTFNMETDQKTILENIEAIQTLWGGILVWDSKNKVIHLRDETLENSDFNAWKGFDCRRGKNYSQEPQIQIDNDLVTRAYPIGQGDIHIKKVNNDLLYIDNFSYTNVIYERYISNPNIPYTGDDDLSGQTQLKAWGERELAKLCRPRTTYVFHIEDRHFEKPFSHELFDINDVIQAYVIDPVTLEETVVEQRIIEITRDVWSDKSLVLTGDKILNNREIFELTYKNSETVSGLVNWNGNISAGNVQLTLPNFSLDDFWDFQWDRNEGFDATIDKNLADFNNHVSAYKEHVKLYTEFVKDTGDEFIKTYAGIELVSNKLGSHIDIYTAYTKVTDQAIIDTNASINVVSNELGSHINAYTNYTIATDKSIAAAEAGISVNSTAISANLTLFTSFKTQTTSDINGLQTSITAANTSISSISTKLEANITLTASYGTRITNVETKTTSLTSSVATITTNANALSAKVSLQASTISTLEDDVDTVSTNFSSALTVASTSVSLHAKGTISSSSIRIISSYITLTSGTVQINCTNFRVYNRLISLKTATDGDGNTITYLGAG